MAMITFPGLKEYERKLARLAKDADAIAGKAIYQGAAVIADGIRENIRGLPVKTGVTTDGLLDGLGIAPLQQEGGYYNVKIGFDGYNKNGEPNLMMARIMESGTSKVKKHPFVRPAVTARRGQAEAAMAAVLDAEISKVME